MTRLAGNGATRLALAIVLLLAARAQARPGGGHSFHGSSHSSSRLGSSSHHSSSSHSSHTSGHSSGSSPGSVGSGDPALENAASTIGTAARLVTFFTIAGVVLVLAILAILVLVLVSRRHAHWDSTDGARAPASVGLEALHETDPDFSEVLFRDFAYALYARAHEARADRQGLDRLSPYLSDAARTHLAAREPLGSMVQAVVVGAMRVEDVVRDNAQVLARLGFESNLTLAGGGATQYVRERWWLARPLAARTHAWKGLRSFGCPACGGSLEENASDVCPHCGQRVDDGRFDWKVERIEVDEVEARPPSLTGTVEEEGTDLPTVYQDGCAERLAALLRDDPALTLEGLGARFGLIFAELQKGWAAQELRGVRPFVSASLYDHLGYWVEAYRRQGLRNQVDAAAIVQTEVVRVVRDAHYDALTLRLWGTGCDSTTRAATGEVVGGSRTQPRPYSEYWTLVRGASVRGAPRADGRCPSCGAAVRVSMEGNCEYCGVLVASGDFDWVLSQIEQDESYSG